MKRAKYWVTCAKLIPPGTIGICPDQEYESAVPDIIAENDEQAIAIFALLKLAGFAPYQVYHTVRLDNGGYSDMRVWPPKEEGEDE